MGGNIFKLDELRVKKGLDTVSIWKCLFADDAAVFAHTEEQLQQIINVFTEVTIAFGQEFLSRKLKFLL